MYSAHHFLSWSENFVTASWKLIAKLCAILSLDLPVVLLERGLGFVSGSEFEAIPHYSAATIAFVISTTTARSLALSNNSCARVLTIFWEKDWDKLQLFLLKK